MTYLPSKKFIVFVLIILLAGAGIFWLSGNGKLDGKNKIAFEKQGSLMPFQQNSDNSGWEEALQKVSAYSSVDKNILSNQASDTNSGQISETEKFSQDFLTQYLMAKQIAGGNNLDAATKDNLINSLINNVNSVPVAPTYKLSDIKISEDNSETAVRNYGNRLISIVKSYGNPAPGDEIEIFGNMIKNNNEDMASQLNKNVSMYDDLKKDILGLIVPSEIKDQHLKLLNSIVLFKDIAEKMRNYFKDPLAGFVAAKQYQRAATDYVDSLTEINKFLKDKLK
ncbi:MAG: hypothetical protein NTX55_00085 [Candidatus Parcubacteria bacterium]|nr:hypothetical protein [Candidatus Parcubacteria bacterium]